MRFGRFRLGMRTLKTALAVMLCLLLFHVTNRGTPMIAALSAVFSLRQDFTTSLSFGRSRVIGNTLGGLAALIYFHVGAFFKNDFIVELLLMPLLMMLVIVISDAINNHSGIIPAAAALLLIALSIPQGDSSVYTLNRILDTFIGTLIAIGLNSFIVPKKPEQEKQIQEDLLELQKQEASLTKKLAQVKEQIKAQS